MFRNFTETISILLIMLLSLVVVLIILVIIANVMSFIVKVFILDMFDFDRKPSW